MGERRRTPRKKSFLRGCIYFNKRRGAVDCLVRDISGDGARLVFSDAVNVPDLVELYIPQKEQTLHARVQWRHGQEVGVAFPDRVPAEAAASGDLTERVAALETEIAALRRALRRLKSEIASGGDDEAA
jgi:PilZ domain